MSAVIPPKKPPRLPLKLSLPGSSGSPAQTQTTPPLSLQPPSSSSSSLTSSSSLHTPAATNFSSASSASSSRPSLKLPSLSGGSGGSSASLTTGLASLSLSIPPSHYGRSGGNDSDEEEDPKWKAGAQVRMADELKDALHGPVASEDDLLLTGRPRSHSRGALSERRPSRASSVASLARANLGVGDSLVETPSTARPLDQDPESPREEELFDIRPETLEDMGRLGEGASGEVRKVRHIPTGKIMAKKSINTSPDPKKHKQHLRELLFMRECQNPYIVEYYGGFLDEHDTQIGICMEYCEGGSLDSLYKQVKRNNYLTGEKILSKIAESILFGLSYLHSRKIIHRDIKPSNVLVTRDGQVKLCDFGVSGELVNSFAGTSIGTTYYLAPERMRCEPYSITSDVWSLVLTVLEVALNRFPFPLPGEPPLPNGAAGYFELLSYVQAMENPVRVLDTIEGVKYTKAFKEFVRECLQKDSRRRPTPEQLLSSPWIMKSRTRPDQANLSRWTAEVTGTA